MIRVFFFSRGSDRGLRPDKTISLIFSFTINIQKKTDPDLKKKSRFFLLIGGRIRPDETAPLNCPLIIKHSKHGSGSDQIPGSATMVFKYCYHVSITVSGGPPVRKISKEKFGLDCLISSMAR